MKTFPRIPLRLLGIAALFALLVAAPAHARLDVEVWTDRGDDAVYREGEAMQLKVRTSEDAFLLVYEIDTEGRINLLYPWKRGSGRIEGRRTLRLPPDESDHQLVVGKETGQGFLVAVASEAPFRDLPWFLRPFDPQAASVGYEGAPEGPDEEGFDEDGRVVGDPYVAMERIRRRVMDDPGATELFASSYSTYYVHEQVRYPRYICNDCHRPNRWAWWPNYDPYYANCSVFDFRVNWNWCWGPQVWTAYVPYYYYVVRTDCPPRYAPWAGNRNRFSAWDGWTRWSDLWGGQLRRYKSGPAPVSYQPPPPRGMIWRKGDTPPGFVPKNVQRETKSPGVRPKDWMTRTAGDGRPVWRDRVSSQPARDARRDPNVGRDTPKRDDNVRERWRTDGRTGRPTPGGRRDDSPRTPRGEGERPRMDRDEPRGGDRPVWRPAPSQDSPPRERGQREDPPRRYEPRRHDPPRQDPPRQDPPRQEPSRQEPVYKEPLPQQQPRWSPPPQAKPDRPDPPRGKGHKG